MTEREKKQLLARAEKLRPRPTLLPSGSWRVQIMLDGERVSVTADTPERAHAMALAEKEGLIQKKKEEEESRRGNITLANAIDQYISARANILSPSTQNGYKEIKRNRFSTLMGTKVSRIDEKAIQIAVNEDAKSVSAKTIKNALGLVVAVVSEYHDINVKRIRMPQRKRKEHAYLDEQGMIDFFDAIRGSYVEIPLLLATWLGMRRSEIMGLCWDCIDFENNKIHVRRTYVKAADGSGYVLRDEMKTEASRRTLECPSYIMQKLKDYTPLHREGRVFSMHPNSLYKKMKSICEDNNIDFVGVHGLRHTNASVMLSLGIIDKVAMARGGWSTDVTMRSVYQHLFQPDKDAAGEKVDSYFDSISKGVSPKKSAEQEQPTE